MCGMHIKQSISDETQLPEKSPRKEHIYFLLYLRTSAKIYRETEVIYPHLKTKGFVLSLCRYIVLPIVVLLRWVHL